MAGLKIVSCCAGDAGSVKQCLPGLRGTSEADQLPHRTFAAIAWDDNQARPAGYLSLDDAPAICNSTAAAVSPAAAAAADGLGYKQSSTLYVQQLQAEEGPVLQLLLQHAFVHMPHVKQILMVSKLDFDADIQQQQQQPGQQQQAPPVPDAAVTLFAKAAQVAESSSWLYECSRQVVLPPLQVRHARVEDHDDLLPIVSAAAAGPCPSLAALPQSCQPDEPFALTRLINSRDDQNLVLVAEDEGRPVGLLVATLQLDASLLIQAFDLGFGDAFMPPDVYEECETAAKHAAAEKAAQQSAAAGEQDSVAPADPTPEQIREELVPLLLAAFAKCQKQQKQPPKGTAPAAPHNLAAITMLCMQAGYEDRAIDFMPALFAECPQQDYCALTLPHSASQPQLARHMTLLRPVPGSSFPQAVLLLHRASLALHMGADWEVRLAVPDDVVALHGLMGSVSNAVQLQEAFLHAVGRQGAVVASINGEMVGMLASSPCTPELLGSWSARYRLDDSLPCSCLRDHQQHAQVTACVINPVFAAQAGALLAASLRLLDKPYLHYVLGPYQPAPAEVLSVMQQQPSHRGRGRTPPGGTTQQPAGVGGALFSFAKGMAHMPRHVINAQVVAVGASETGLACLEHLLMQPDTRFTNLTLLAPGGVRTDGIARQFTAERVSRLGLHANVTIVDSHMVALDPQQQLLMLADGGRLTYDLLAVATGLQDQLGPAVAGAFPDAAHFVLSAKQLMASSITPVCSSSLRSVLVYGADLHAFDALATLIEAGVDADAITWVCPGAEQQAPSLPLLRGLAAQLGLELPEPQQGRLLELVPNADGTRAVAALQALDAGEDGPLQQMELDLLIGCGSLQPSAIVASCLASAYIVWDGRLVVDAQFCSSDPCVMGAGPVAKFSRRYTLPEVRQEQYSSCELGVKLAEAIVRRFQSAAVAAAPTITQHTATGGGSSSQGQGADSQPAQPTERLQGQQQGQTDVLPALWEGKVVGCRLPSGQIFLCGGCADAAAAPVLPPPPGGCTLISKTEDKSAVLSIALDADSNVNQVAYVGSWGSAEAAAAHRAMGLVGLPFSYVAAGLGLPDCLSEMSAPPDSEPSAAELQVSGESDTQQGPTVPGVSPAAPEMPGVWLLEKDVLAELQKPWAQLLFHEDFSKLRQQLLAGSIGAEGVADGQGSSSAEQDVQQLVVEFLQSCRAQLSGYQVQAPSGGASAVC